MIKTGNKLNLCQKLIKAPKIQTLHQSGYEQPPPSYHFGIYKLSKW